ncbi:MAG: DEAD/DEAH box helicase [Turicibacter sp.]|nr:DEAD/DEAH box helicase [Turicibacter sp.]
MDAYQLLSKNLQKKIYDMKWEAFTQVQKEAIPAILTTDKHVILNAATASGKTEAAFLPVLTAIEKTGMESLKAIYVSPLKALINNQFERIDKLCEGLHIDIHRWHGDISAHQKKKFTKAPTGILQITPESLESLFVNRQEHLANFFSQLEFVIVDEIHSFIGTARGVQLRSLISRMEAFSNHKVRIIGLSATLGDFEPVKAWCGPGDAVLTEDGPSGRTLLYHLMHFPGYQGVKPRRMFEDILELTAGRKALIFCNSRAVVEETVVALNGLAGTENYFAHHSAIDKNEREHVESLMMRTVDKSIVATSSLELGIDIGNVDLVIQIDSPHSVASLRQRLGRTGRRKGQDQILQLYTTHEASLLKTIATMELMLEGWVEPPGTYPLPYDILIQQALSTCAEHHGIAYELLELMLKQNPAFQVLDASKVRIALKHMVKTGLLHILPNQEVIVGLEGARLLKGKEFYAVFMAASMYDVYHGQKKIGQLEKSDLIMVGDTVMLAGKPWAITEIDDSRDCLYVSPSISGESPKFEGGKTSTHVRVAEKVYELLLSGENFDYLDVQAAELLDELREPYGHSGLTAHHRPLFKEGIAYQWELFTDTVTVNTIVAMLKTMGVSILERDILGRVTFIYEGSVGLLLDRLLTFGGSTEELLEAIQDRAEVQSRYFEYVPAAIQEEMLVAHELDLIGALKFLHRFKFKIIHST